MTARKSHTYLLVSLALALLCACAHTRLKVGKNAQGEVVEAEGLAPNEGKDLILIKRASLVDAQRNAIEKAVGVFVSAKTLVEKAVAIENNILARTDGYIKKYDILSEGVEGSFYKTKIRALVALKDLEKDLKDMSLLNTPELQRPRVLIDVKEEVDKQILDDDTLQNSLQKSLMAQGFVVVTEERAKEAEILLKGKASSFPFQSDGLGGFVSYRARLSVQALRAGTKDVVLSYTKEASGLGGNAELASLKSFETIGDMAGKDIATQLPEALKKGKNVLVFVEGVKSFADVERVRKHLTSEPGVADLILRLYDEEMAQFELQLDTIYPSELASHLERSSTLRLKVVEASTQSIRLKLE